MHRFNLKKGLVLGVIAAVVLAIIVAVTGGSASAGRLITGRDIKDNSVGSVDVRDSSLKTADIKDGQVKITDLDPVLAKSLANLILNPSKAQDGAAGPKGDKGEAGTNGTNGQDGTSNPSAAGAGYTSTWAAHSAGQTVQKCRAGEYVTGGGYSTWGGEYDLGNNPDIQVTVSAPYIQGEYEPISDSDSRFYADQWVVRGYNNGDTDQVVRAWVLCAPLPN